MPQVLKVKALIFFIHTRDHGHPHVTVYYGRPKNHEAFAKVNLLNLSIIEQDGFHSRDLKVIVKITAQYMNDWLEVWYESQENQ